MRKNAIDLIVAGSARSIGKLMLDVDRLHVERFATTHGGLHSMVEANGDTENKTSTCQTCPCSGVDCP
jgi:hypothetical protein